MPDSTPAARLQSPNRTAWLGTDGLGRDLCARLFLAAPNSLGVAVAAACLAVIPGALLGALAATWRLADAPLMRLADALLTLPPLVLAPCLPNSLWCQSAGTNLCSGTPRISAQSAVCPRLSTEPNLRTVVSRLTRTRHTRGVALFWILLRPLAPSLAVLFAQVVAVALLVEGLLGFLGLGLPPSHPGWGSMLAEGRALLFVAPQVILVPGVCIALFAFLVQLFADSLNPFAEPR